MKFDKLNKAYFVLSLIVLLIMQGCYNPSKISYFNISSSYEEQARRFDFKFCAFNYSENQVNIYYKFNTAGLLFIKHKTKDYFYAKYQIRYEIYDSNEPKILVDSATFRYINTTDFNSPKEILDSFPIQANKALNYIISYEFTDLNKSYIMNGFINCNKANECGRNNFLLKDEENFPLIENYTEKGQSFKMQVNNRDIEKLYVNYYNQEFPLAYPPYSLNVGADKAMITDSNFVLTLHKGLTDNLVLNNTGIYFFRSDTSQENGFSVFRFYKNFPLVTTPAQMLKPLQYITTKLEYEDITNSKNLKSAIDNYWVKKTGNIDRAQELIKLFYNRVQDANILFTSYKEGWKTDRGMIYIVLGPPSKVYRSATNETWYYGEDRNMVSITMVFTKIYLKFSDNDYLLDRGIEYKDPWYIGVESWRK